MAIFNVALSEKAKKNLKKIPIHIVDKLDVWIASVERDGLQEVRKIPGFHDEPLLGKRWGQRSIRLSRAYRAIYRIKEKKEIEFVNIEEVSKHDY